MVGRAAMCRLLREVFSNEMTIERQPVGSGETDLWYLETACSRQKPRQQSENCRGQCAGTGEPGQRVMEKELRIVGVRQEGCCRSCRSLSDNRKTNQKN